MAGSSIRFAAADSPSEHSLRASALDAACVATREAEHAVFIVEHGPCKPSEKEIRPEATAIAPPLDMNAKTLSASGELARMSPNSVAIIATNTPAPTSRPSLSSFPACSAA
eukprot:7372730-Prymnesium_polylepis.2